MALVTSETDDPVRVVAAHRDTGVLPDSPLAATIADLARQDLAIQLALRPLDEEAAAQLLGALLPAPPAALRAILERADGVPFFLVSLAQAAGLAGGLDRGEPSCPGTSPR